MFLLRLVLAAITVGVSHAQPRTYWVHDECPDEVQRDVFRDAQEMARNALYLRDPPPVNPPNRPEQDALNRAAQSFQQVVDHIYFGASDAELWHVWNAFNSILQVTRASNREDANILIYCDNDDGFIHAPDHIMPGNSGRGEGYKAWWDPVNYIAILKYEDRRTSDRLAVPSCKKPETGGATYCAAFGSDTSDLEGLPAGAKCRITLCDSLWKEAKYHSVYSIEDSKDFSRRKWKPFRTTVPPNVDDLGRGMTSATAAHEYYHTLFEQAMDSTTGVITDQQVFIDSNHPNSYGWEAFRFMGKKSSLENADSIAYLGLCARIIMRGLHGRPRKIYTFARDGSIHSD